MKAVICINFNTARINAELSKTFCKYTCFLKSIDTELWLETNDQKESHLYITNDLSIFALFG